LAQKRKLGLEIRVMRPPEMLDEAGRPRRAGRNQVDAKGKARLIILELGGETAGKRRCAKARLPMDARPGALQPSGLRAVT
jgi:hypothetical protein